MSNRSPSTERKNIATVQQNGLAIKHIKNPGEAVQTAAVQQTGMAIRFIQNPSEAVQLAAVQQNARAIEFVKDPNEVVQLAAVRQNGWVIGQFENPSEAVQLAAVTQDGLTMVHIKNPSEAAQFAAVRQNGRALQYIKGPTEAMKLIAVQQNGQAIQFVKNPSEAMQLAAFSCGGGFSAAHYWSDTFYPSASMLVRAIQESEVAFSSAPPPLTGATLTTAPVPSSARFYKNGITAVLSRLVGQPANDILDLAAVAPEIFDPHELREILRNALLEQAQPTQEISSPRPL